MTKRARGHDEKWRHAAARALVVIGVSGVGFLLVPDFLIRRLSTATTPAIRDGVVLGWTIVCTIVTSWVLLRSQTARERARARSEEGD